ncbi:MAG TPA: acylphosphatase [Dehalococcoidales bacterium]|nr:acylphosphatase [Dehalococcoidales bacterium]
MIEPVALHAIVYGRVQGVYFRTFVVRRGAELGLTGYARNLPDGTVEVRAEGETGQLQRLLDRLKTGPPAARVEKVDTDWSANTEGYTTFRIRY